jgi:hypothetical protein
VTAFHSIPIIGAVSRYEIAKLRLKAWEMTGNMTMDDRATGKPRSLTWEEQEKWADELTRWALFAAKVDEMVAADLGISEVQAKPQTTPEEPNG